MATILSAVDRATRSLGANPDLPGVISQLRSASVAVPTTTSGLGANPDYIGERAVYPYYTYGGDRGQRARLAFYVALQGFKEVHSRATGPAILTLIELVFPGMLARFDVGMSGVIFRKEIFPLDLAGHLLLPEQPVTVIAGTGGTPDTTVNTAAPDLPENAAAFLYDLEYSVDIVRSGNTFLEAVFLLGMFLYTIGKDPGELNIAAFTTNRLEMFRSITGIPAAADSLLTPDQLPTVEELKKVKGFFNINSRFRKVVIRELARWDLTTSCTDDQEAILGFVRLWKLSGMTHIFLIAAFINNYRAVLSGMPGLRTEAERFVLQYNTWQRQEKTYLSPYNRVIDGGRSSWLRSRDFPELLKLARWVASLENPRMKKYAQRSGRSFYQDSFIMLAAEYGVDLSMEVAPDVEES